MKNTKDLSGNKYGKLLVIERILNSTKDTKKSWYRCLCDCGKEKEFRGSSLSCGNSKSCGCVRTESIRNKQGKKPFEYLYKLLVANSIKRKHEMYLSYEEFVEFTKIDRCHYCDSEIVWVLHPCDRPKKGYGYNLDRKDNTKGYSVENCVVCCRRCNWSRSDTFSYEEWVEIGKTIKKFREDKCRQTILK